MRRDEAVTCPEAPVPDGNDPTRTDKDPDPTGTRTRQGPA